MTTPRFAFPHRLRTKLAGWSVVGTWVREDYPGERRAHPGHETYVERTYWADATEGMGTADAVCHALSAWDEHGEPDAVTVVRHWHYHDPDQVPADPFQDITGEQGGHEGYLANRRKGA